ncbi:MAG: nitroreductase family protein [Candidatus Bathyarchaeota archaeon]
MQAFARPIEQEASRRQSMRSFTSENVPRQQLLEVLWAAYGQTNGRGNVPRIGTAYSLVLFTVNGTGSYKYVPESNSLVVHDLTVNKESIRSYSQDWPSNAKEVLVIVWDQTKLNNHYFACAEAGCLAQNVHLAASSLDLGTCVVGTINNGGLRNVLGLSSTQTPLFVMPISYPTSFYTAATPKFTIMTGNLPQVQYSESTFENAVTDMVFAQEWSEDSLSVQELSQLLWASYGYTSTDHRTTPSANGIYPLIVYASNATGVYRYLPESHSVTEITGGDKRLEIANTFSGQTWAADAPTLFLISYDSNYNSGNTGDGGALSHLFMEVNTGCVIQQLVLEASAWNLQANILSQGFEAWNGAGAQTLRSILGFSTSIIPLYAVPVGAPASGDGTAPTIGDLSQNPSYDAVEPDQTVTVTVEVTDAGTGVGNVILSYSTDEGQTWTNATMTGVSGNMYSGDIPGFEEETRIQYRILAYDNSNNLAVEDNAGNYYVYTVIPEFQFLILAFFVLTSLAVILAKRRTITKQP